MHIALPVIGFFFFSVMIIFVAAFPKDLDDENEIL